MTEFKEPFILFRNEGLALEGDSFEVTFSELEQRLTVCGLRGAMTLHSKGLMGFYREVLSLHQKGNYRFVLDLSGLQTIDSSGIGIVLRIARVAEEHGCRPAVICPDPEITALFRLMGLSASLDYFNDISEAVRSFGVRAPEERIDMFS